MLAFLLVACADPADTGKPGDSADDDTDDTDAACDTGTGLAPQPDEDYLADFRPVVVRTVPQAGDQAVDPNLTELRVTFSKDMNERAWSWVQVNERQYPETGDVGYADARTNVLEVSLEHDQTYVLWINYDPDFMNFKDEAGNSAVPYQLAFRTRAE